jgi:hypothetical protein
MEVPEYRHQSTGFESSKPSHEIQGAYKDYLLGRAAVYYDINLR